VDALSRRRASFKDKMSISVFGDSSKLEVEKTWV